eukprot:830643_1
MEGADSERILPSQTRGIGTQIENISWNIPPSVEALHLSEYESLNEKYQNLQIRCLKEVCFDKPEIVDIDYINSQNLNGLERINICGFDGYHSGFCKPVHEL